MRRKTETDETLHAEVVGAPRRPSLDFGGELLANRYRLLELLGAGGMGTVYRAEDTELDEIVALKTLRRELVDAPGALDRFRRELKLARRVTHRGVARAFDMGDHDGERFLTMEYVEGDPLTRKLDGERALSVADCVRIARDIAEALAAAHAVGVVHRDLKPDNVLIAHDGRVVLTDFGVARLVDGGDARATRAGMVVGTPAYMAPEQVEGREVDARADLYALGVMLFEMLSGELPFVADTPLAMAAIRLSTPPRDLARLAPATPTAIVDLVSACLARDAAKRPASAAEVAQRLASIDTAELPAAQPRASERPPRPASPETNSTRRLAVAPFRLTGPTTESWMAEAVAEDLIDALSMTRGLKVRGRTGAYLPGESPAEFGARQEVDVVVDGSLRCDGDRVRLALRLISVADGFQIWAERSDGEVKDLLALCDAGAAAIANALSGTSHELRPAASPSGAAVELYLRAKRTAAVLDVGDEAVALMARAVELAPDDPTILAAFAVLGSRNLLLRPQSDDLSTRIQAAASKARALAPNLPEARLALARSALLRADHVEAMRNLVAARQITESNADVEQLLGRFVVDTDEVERAKKHFDRALWVDTESHFSRVDLVRIASFEGDRATALAHLGVLRTRSMSHFGIAAPRAAIWLGDAVVFDESEAPNPFLTAYSRVIRTAVREGSCSDAVLDAFYEARDRWGVSRHLRALATQLTAEMECLLGMTDRALESASTAVDLGLADLAWMRRSPALAPLRTAPAWPALERAVQARTEPVRHTYLTGSAPS